MTTANNPDKPIDPSVAPSEVDPPLPGQVVVETDVGEDGRMNYATAEIPIPAGERDQVEEDFEVIGENVRRIGLKFILERIETADQLRDVVLMQRSLLSTYLEIGDAVGSPPKVKGAAVNPAKFYTYSAQDIYDSYAAVKVAAERLNATINAQRQTIAERDAVIVTQAKEMAEMAKLIADNELATKATVATAVLKMTQEHDLERAALRAQYSAYYLSANSKPYVLLSISDAGRMVKETKEEKGYRIYYDHTQDFYEAMRFKTPQAALDELEYITKVREEGVLRHRVKGEVRSLTESMINPANYRVAVLKALVLDE